MKHIKNFVMVVIAIALVLTSTTIFAATKNEAVVVQKGETAYQLMLVSFNQAGKKTFARIMKKNPQLKNRLSLNKKRPHLLLFEGDRLFGLNAQKIDAWRNQKQQPSKTETTGTGAVTNQKKEQEDVVKPPVTAQSHNQIQNIILLAIISVLLLIVVYAGWAPSPIQSNTDASEKKEAENPNENTSDVKVRIKTEFSTGNSEKSDTEPITSNIFEKSVSSEENFDRAPKLCSENETVFIVSDVDEAETEEPRPEESANLEELFEIPIRPTEDHAEENNNTEINIKKGIKEGNANTKIEFGDTQLEISGHGVTARETEQGTMVSLKPSNKPRTINLTTAEGEKITLPTDAKHGFYAVGINGFSLVFTHFKEFKEEKNALTWEDSPEKLPTVERYILIAPNRKKQKTTPLATESTVA